MDQWDFAVTVLITPASGSQLSILPMPALEVFNSSNTSIFPLTDLQQSGGDPLHQSTTWTLTGNTGMEEPHIFKTTCRFEDRNPTDYSDNF